MSLESKKSWFGNSKYPAKVYFMCGWPLLLVFIGGAIGGFCAALAFSINLKIYKSELLNPLKIILNVLTGFITVLVWFIVATSLGQYFLHN
nr:hypothetical protein [Acinetobacter sp. Marseille-Q1620]